VPNCKKITKNFARSLELKNKTNFPGVRDLVKKNAKLSKNIATLYFTMGYEQLKINKESALPDSENLLRQGNG